MKLAAAIAGFLAGGTGITVAFFAGARRGSTPTPPACTKSPSHVRAVRRPHDWQREEAG